MPRTFTARLAVLSLTLTLAGGALAADAASLAGQQPEALLRTAPAFAKAYRQLAGTAELPAWTRRLAAGTPAETVRIGDRDYLLTSACSQRGCLDERLYLLFDPGTRTLHGFFFLPPQPDQPGDARMAFSQWLGKPGKEIADFLMARAMQDVQAALPANH